MGPVPYRLRIGVTGHRVLLDEDELAQRVRDVLGSRLVELFDETSARLIASARHTPVALSVLTPLAEGADRLLAREVLAMPLGAIEAVLPFPKKQYENDFETPESRREFEQLLSRATRSSVLNRRLGPVDATETDLAEAKRQAYVDVGRYTVDHCDLLIALWDGQPARGEGGTAKVVEYAKEVGRPLVVISTTAPYEVELSVGHALSAEAFSRLEAFNSFPIPEAKQAEYVENAYRDIFEAHDAPAVCDENKAEIRSRLLPVYVRASAIAEHSQKAHERAGRLVYGSSLLALTSVAVGVLFPDIAPFAFGLEFLLLLLVLATVFFADRGRVHRQWVENRFLAERIRSAVFFAACGFQPSALRVPAHLGRMRSSGKWMLAAFDETWDAVRTKRQADATLPGLARFVRERWIEDQLRYHESKSRAAERVSRRLEVGGMLIFAVALLAPAAHLILFRPGLGLEARWLEMSLTLAAIILPALGATLEGVRSHGEYSRIAKRSENMAEALRELDHRAGQVRDQETLHGLMHEVEELMLVEAADWLALMRFTKVETVA